MFNLVTRSDKFTNLLFTNTYINVILFWFEEKCCNLTSSSD